jgi:hypothetical protein
VLHWLRPAMPSLPLRPVSRPAASAADQLQRSVAALRIGRGGCEFVGPCEREGPAAVSSGLDAGARQIDMLSTRWALKKEVAATLRSKPPQGGVWETLPLYLVSMAFTSAK